jgi:UDP-N-acetylglucosamine 2-epimerase (non-hydrolysing)
MTSVVYVVGARPNFVKLAPVVAAMRRRLPSFRHVLVHTEQHYDSVLSEVFFKELGLPQPDHLLEVGSGAHGAQTARALERIEAVLLAERPELVVVAGDVNSTLAGALAAAKLTLPVAHVEAGLRSFDRTMPEEVNRVLVDQISRWCFIHSPEARQNLIREGIGDSCIYAVGNTMIDTLVRIRPLLERSRILDRLGVAAQGYLLVTLHRPALVDGELLEDTLENLAALARSVPVVFPVHPRTRARIPKTFSAPGVQLIEPLGYADFLALEEQAYAVITDSGGVQEETTYLRVPCFTLRAATERPITVSHGTNRILGLDPRAIEQVPEWVASTAIPLSSPDGWDGRAAERVADHLAADLAPAGEVMVR